MIGQMPIYSILRVFFLHYLSVVTVQQDEHILSLRGMIDTNKNKSGICKGALIIFVSPSIFKESMREEMKISTSLL